MERMKHLPLYKRFGFRVLLFNGLLLFSIIGPIWIIRNGDYKDLMDRFAVQGELFTYCRQKLDDIPAGNWPESVQALPALLPMQRILLFDSDGSPDLDSGIMKAAEDISTYGLLLPHPYISLAKGDEPEPEALIRALKLVPGAAERDFERKQLAIINVRCTSGLNRVIVHAREIQSAEGDWRLLIVTSSVVDLLLQNRAVKERFMILFLAVAALGLGLTIVLSRSVTMPFQRLYRYSRNVLRDPRIKPESVKLPGQGEIGEICRALHSLIEEQRNQADNFRRFSSDIIHELRTPLSAIRSGLELYAESSDAAEQEAIYSRIQRRMKQMEGLMEEIHQLGKLESSVELEYCGAIEDVFQEIKQEFQEWDIALSMAGNLAGRAVPVSADKLGQIVRNLVGNAVSFSPDRGSVSVSVFRDEEKLQIQVEDSGPGIPEEALQHLTERFYSYRPNGEVKHSGLGLAIVQAIVGSCKGGVNYGNLDRGGAWFSVQIPLTDSV